MSWPSKFLKSSNIWLWNCFVAREFPPVCVCSSCAFCLLLFFTHANMQKNTQKIPTKTNQIILIGICLRAAARLVSTGIILNLRYTYLLSWCLMEVSVQMPACQVVLFKFFNTYEYTTLYIWSFDRYSRSFTRLQKYFEFYDLRPFRKNL